MLASGPRMVRIRNEPPMIRRWLRRALRIHSPSGHALGTCWCKPESAAEVFAREVEAYQAMVENGLSGTWIESYLADVETRPLWRVTFENPDDPRRVDTPRDVG